MTGKRIHTMCVHLIVDVEAEGGRDVEADVNAYFASDAFGSDIRRNFKNGTVAGHDIVEVYESEDIDNPEAPGN